MPLYEYVCDSCGFYLETMQSFSDPPITVCGWCEGRMKKLLSAPAFQFKGSGWYVSDYARAGAKSGEKAGEKSASDGGSGSSESAPAAPAAETKTEKKDAPAPAAAPAPKGD